MLHYHSIRMKLLFSFVAVILLPLVTLGIIGPLISAGTIEAEKIINTTQLIRQVTKNIETRIRQIESTVSILVNDPNVQAFLNFDPAVAAFPSGSEAGMHRLLGTISGVHPEIAGILIVNSRNAYFSNEIRPITRDPLSSEPWYLQAVGNLGTVQLLPRPVGRNLRNTVEYSADDVVSIVKAAVDPETGMCLGVVLVDMKLKVMEDIFRDLTLGFEGFLFIEGERGNTVYAPVNPIVYRVRSDWLSSPPTVRTIGGADYQIITQDSEYTSWKTIGVFPLNQIMRQVSTIRYYSLIIAGVTVVFAFMASVFFTASTARPVIQLQALMKEAEEGNFAVRYDGHQEDEIGRLGKSFNAMIEEIQKLIDMVYREQQSKREAELKTLQEQIKPHFLYNTLDTIQWMAQEHGADDIVKIVNALTSLFRIGLSRGREMIPVADELEHVRSYLIIQKTRYEDKFDFSIDAPQEVLSFMVLKLTLQPLVENAIYHGIKERRGNGTIRVCALLLDGMLVFRVIDDGVGMTAEKLAEVRLILSSVPSTRGRSGYGISNVHERIQLSFGARYGLRFESAPDQGTTVEMLHPLVGPEER